MKSMVLMLFVSAFVISSAGCRKSPWRAERYIDEKTEKVIWSQQFPSYGEYEDYFVNGAFIELRIKAHNETLHTANAPYYLIINGVGFSGKHKRLRIHNLNLTSDLNHRYDISNTLSGFPIEYEFRIYEDRPEFVIAHCRFHKDLYLDFAANETLTFMLDVEVLMVDGGAQRKQIKCDFTPKLEQGDYQMIHH